MVLKSQCGTYNKNETYKKSKGCDSQEKKT